MVHIISIGWLPSGIFRPNECFDPRQAKSTDIILNNRVKFYILNVNFKFKTANKTLNSKLINSINSIEFGI